MRQPDVGAKDGGEVCSREEEAGRERGVGCRVCAMRQVHTNTQESEDMGLKYGVVCCALILTPSSPTENGTAGTPQ